MSGWGDLFDNKYEMVKDESTGEMIMVDKSAKKHKLDAQGNIVDPAPSGGAPASNGFGSAAGGAAPSFGGGSSSAAGGGFVFGSGPAAAPAATGGFSFGSGGGGGGAAAAPAAGGFVFGGGGGAAAAPAAGGFTFGAGGGGGAAPAAASGGGFTFGSGGGDAPAAASGGGGGGFVFGAGSAASPAAAGGASKRGAEAMERRTEAKRRRTRDLRLTGSESGKVLVVGNGDCGQLGLGEEDDDVRDAVKAPVPLRSLDSMRVCQLACGGLHTGALTLDGRVWTWGCNDDEVLGRGGNESVPAVVEGELASRRVTIVSAGDSHMAALTSEGQIFSWGTYKDSNGYIGHSASAQKAATPTLVPNLPTMRHVASGADHTLGVSADGYEVYGWGCGEKGQLGLGELEWERDTKKRYLQPTKPFVIRLPDETNSLSGAKARLVRALNGNFLQWAKAQVGETPGVDLAEGCEAYLDHLSQLDAEESSLDDRLQLAGCYGGAYHSFVLTVHGNVYAFGLNNMGQLGFGSLEPNHTGTPTLVSALEGKGVSMLCGGEHHSLALTDDGAVYAFGRGDNNQLGFGDGTEQQLEPRRIESLRDVNIRRLGCGSNQNVAVSRSGDLYSWGFGEMGQLCNGKASDEPTPTLVESAEVAGAAVLDADSGGQHSVVLTMERAD